MLEVPQKRELGTPPCFRCLFEKVISEAVCDPPTCMMLEHYLTDEDFSWKKYVFGWQVQVELRYLEKNTMVSKQ